MKTIDIEDPEAVEAWRMRGRVVEPTHRLGECVAQIVEECA
ncbi:hypothetical protein [Nocardia miyunensis]|nr:hypothetical protein [Nocardia miyunensis]